MGDRLGRLSACAQVRIKVCRKDLCWSVGLVYDPSRLQRVTTARPEVAGVLQSTHLMSNLGKQNMNSNHLEESYMIKA
jgi:hypothetical protein